jgi:chromate transporter
LQTPSSKPSTVQVTGAIFRIGNTTFGGGFITMIIIGRDFVNRRGWLTQSQFDTAFSLARITPGTNIVAFCAAVAAMLRGWPGAILAVAALTVPSALIAVLLMQGFESWRGHPWVMAALGATTAAVTGMMWSTVWLLTKPHLGGRMKALQAVVIFGGCFGAAWMGVTPLPIVLGATILGFLWTAGEDQ